MKIFSVLRNILICESIDELDKKLSQIMSGDYICGITDMIF